MIKRFCRQAQNEWHPWFAWRPLCLETKTEDGVTCETWVWWEWIERALITDRSEYWIYRLPPVMGIPVETFGVKHLVGPHD
jgi:hypothetical protein